jgi:hypothetical protein
VCFNKVSGISLMVKQQISNLRSRVRFSYPAPLLKETNMSHGGKGSKPRPFSVSQKEYDNRWDAIFGRDLKEEKQEDTSNDERLVSKFDKVKEGN